MKKFFNVLASIFLILMILSLTAFSVFAVVKSSGDGTLSIGDYSFYLANNVLEGSALDEGSLIVSKKSDVSAIANGDYLLFENGESISVRYVVDFLSAGEPSFVLSTGDTDKDIVVPTQMIYGKIVYTSAFLGSAAAFASSTVGIIVIAFSAIIIVLLLVFFTTKKGSGVKGDNHIEGALDKIAKEKNSETQKTEETDDTKILEIAKNKKSFDGTIVINKEDLEGPSDLITNILDKSVTNKAKIDEIEEIKKVAEPSPEKVAEPAKKEPSPQPSKKLDSTTLDVGNLSAEDILKDLDGLL